MIGTADRTLIAQPDRLSFFLLTSVRLWFSPPSTWLQSQALRSSRMVAWEQQTPLFLSGLQKNIKMTQNSMNKKSILDSGLSLSVLTRSYHTPLKKPDPRPQEHIQKK